MVTNLWDLDINNRDMKKIALLTTMLVLISFNISAQTHLTFMGIPITGTRSTMISKLKVKGFTEKTQENEVGVELKGIYLGSKVWLRIYNSNISKTVYLIDIFFPKGYFKDLYEQYQSYRHELSTIYGKPTSILDEPLEEAIEYGEYPTCATYYETSKGLVSLEISKDQYCVEISFQDKNNAEIMKKEKTQKQHKSN